MSNAPLHVLQDEEICAQCSRESGGCCIISSSQTANCFPLSLPEVLRLLPHAHLAKQATSRIPDSMLQRITKAVATVGNDFFAHEQIETSALFPLEEKVSHVVATEMNTKEFLSAMQSVLPQHKEKLAEIFSLEEYHFRLRTVESGACAFLGENGCRIPRQARPWYCQSYPGWIYNNELTLFENEKCLVATHSNSPLRGISKLGMIPQDIRFFYDALLRDWKLIN